MTVEYKRMQQLRGTPAEWTADNIVPLDGEFAAERNGALVKLKLGDGVTAYSGLPYLYPPPATSTLGSINAVTTAPPVGAVSGQFWINSGTGNIIAGWGAPVAGLAVVPGDHLMMTPGGTWTLIPTGSNMSGYVQSSALAAVSGAGLVGWSQSGASAVSRTVLAKLREVEVSVADFGAVGDYNTATGAGTDDSLAFTRAFAALGATGGAVRVPRSFKCKVDSSLVIPKACRLVGSASIGTTHPVELLAGGSTIYLATTATIDMQEGAGIVGVNVFRQGLQFNITSTQVAAQFLGTAIRLLDDTSDQLFENMMVLGFAAGIKSQSTSGTVYTNRTKFRGFVGIDCINALQIYNAADIPRLDALQIWPYVSVTSPPETNGAQLKRNGTAVRLLGLNDWTTIVCPFTYGWRTGYWITDGASCTLIAAGADYPFQSVIDGSAGFLIDGAAGEIRLIGPQAVQRDSGVQVNTTSTLHAVTIIAGNFWENRTNGVAVTRGDVQMIGGSTRSSVANSFGVQTGVNAGEVMVSNHDFRNLNRAFVNDNPLVKLRWRDCTFRNLVNVDPANAWQPTVVAADPLVLNGVDAIISVTGNTNFGTIHYGSAYVGRIVTLTFSGTPTVVDGGNLHLAGNFVASAGSTLTLVGSAVDQWFEVSRSQNGG